MSEKEKIKRQIEKAFLDIKFDVRFHTCTALSVHGDLGLSNEYAEFFEQNAFSRWPLSNYPEERKQQRLMLLATFYVLRGRV